ncbi:MAG: hypothetical protein JJE35_14200 [Thermoleophilia bacterium]|nr:hypothetical protein [Thermoleophilia bacterium]
MPLPEVRTHVFPPAMELTLAWMEDQERDTTQDWLLAAEQRAPTLAQLEQRIDHALAVARASEAAALEIGTAALDAAQQARRAAELAERASAGVPAAAAPALVEDRVGSPGGGDAAREPEPDLEFDSLRQFTERADRVAARLRAMAPVP